MSVKQKASKVVEVPKNFFTILFYKFTHHNGKLSKFKILILIMIICYLITQPWTVIRGAIASSFTGYMFNNATDNVLETVVEMEA